MVMFCFVFESTPLNFARGTESKCVLICFFFKSPYVLEIHAEIFIEMM